MAVQAESDAEAATEVVKAGHGEMNVDGLRRAFVCYEGDMRQGAGRMVSPFVTTAARQIQVKLTPH